MIEEKKYLKKLIFVIFLIMIIYNTYIVLSENQTIEQIKEQVKEEEQTEQIINIKDDIANISNFNETEFDYVDYIQENNEDEEIKKKFENNSEIKMKNEKYLPIFNLKIPETINYKTNMYINEKKLNNEFENERIDVIIVLEKPDNIWTETKSFDAKQKKELKRVMLEYSLNEVRKNSDNKIRHTYKSVNGFSATITKDEYYNLINNPLVSSISQDIELQSVLSESVKIIGANDINSYHINNISLSGAKQSVCVIDTGINFNHEAFGGKWGDKIIAGYRFLNEAINCDDDPYACFDGDGHGTHVAGIITNKAELRGVSQGANLVIVKSLNDQGKGNLSNIIKGIEWCVENKDALNISVISMSFGTTTSYDDYCDDISDFSALKNAINYAVDNNIFVVGATGNNGDNGVIAPACIKNVIRVGSTNKQNLVSNFSNIWNKDLLFAPGEQILSTYDNSYEYMSGTSMSAPHISGMITILNEYLTLKNESFNTTQMFNLMYDTGKIINHKNKEYVLADIDSALINLTSLNLEINSPKNIFYNTSQILINIDYNNINSASFYYNGETQIYSVPEIFNFSEGYNELIFVVKNEFNDINRKNVSFVVDLIPPVINVVSPDDVTYNSYEQLINISVTDNHEVKNVWYNWNGTNATYLSPELIRFNEGKTELHVWAEDIAGNKNYMNKSFDILIIPPSIIDFSLNHNKTYFNSFDEISFSVNISHNNSISLYLNEVEFVKDSEKRQFDINTNATTLGCSNMEGECDVTLKIIDANGEYATTKITITIDDLAPRMNNYSTNANSLIKSDDQFEIFLDFEEPNPYSVKINNILFNELLTQNSISVTAQMLGCDLNQICLLEINVTDKSNNYAIDEITISLDDELPVINVVSPNNVTYNLYEQLINISVNDNHEVKNVWYNWNGTNTTYSSPKIIKFDEGKTELHVWAEDTASNKNFKEVIFNIITTPIIINEFKLLDEFVFVNENITLEIITTHNNYIKKLFLNEELILLNEPQNEMHTIIINTTQIGCISNEDCELNLKVVDANNFEDVEIINFMINQNSSQNLSQNSTQNSSQNPTQDSSQNSSNITNTSQSPQSQSQQSISTSTTTTKNSVSGGGGGITEVKTSSFDVNDINQENKLDEYIEDRENIKNDKENESNTNTNITTTLKIANNYDANMNISRAINSITENTEASSTQKNNMPLIQYIIIGSVIFSIVFLLTTISYRKR